MGCESTKIGGVTAIICSRGRRPKRRCSSPGCAGNGEFLCDFVLSNGKTCDRPICRAHSTRPDSSRDVDFCGAHARLVAGDGACVHA